MRDLGRLIVAGARRYPAPALIAAAGLGWLLYRVTKSAPPHVRRARMLEEESIPVLNIGQARIYDPDVSPQHPTEELGESARELGVRA
jgi:hypothetical protein